MPGASSESTVAPSQCWKPAMLNDVTWRDGSYMVASLAVLGVPGEATAAGRVTAADALPLGETTIGGIADNKLRPREAS